jgi:hypothetical protein
VHPSTLAAGFTFSLPSSWEDGPIEVRNFNRIRKVYSQVHDYCVVHEPEEQAICVRTRPVNHDSAYSRLDFFS